MKSTLILLLVGLTAFSVPASARCEKKLETVQQLKRGAMLTLLNSFLKNGGPQGIDLPYDGIYYPRQFRSPIQYRRHTGQVRYTNGRIVDIYASFVDMNVGRAKNDEWFDTQSMEIRAFSANGTGDDKLRLDYQDSLYPTQFAAIRKRDLYVGYIRDNHNRLLRVSVWVPYRNENPNGFDRPQWMANGPWQIQVEVERP